MNLEEWKTEFAGRRILIWGLGREGWSSYKLIRSVCPDLELDIAESRKTGVQLLKRAEAETVHTHCLYDDEVDFDAYDLILKSPGIVPGPQVPREKISGQAPLFLKHYAARTIGVTGTKGKSTTSSLIAGALAKCHRVHLVGNIGTACFDAIPNMQDEDLVVFEISCHQLEFSPYSPHVAVFLNLFEEHLDHYGSMAAYTAAKENIFLHQQEGDIVIINDMLKEQIAKAKHPLLIGTDITAQERFLIVPGHTLHIDQCALVGAHNYFNLAVAYYIACLYGVSDAQFAEAAAEFVPLRHRLEYLGEFDGIRYVNDSISTIGQSCIMALKALPDTDTVLIGGMDRGIEYEHLEDYLAGQPDLNVVFMYASGKRIYDELTAKGVTGHYTLVSDLKEAVAAARKTTRLHRICLLSPAASSYDHFKNFEERGDAFAALARDHAL
jgi:UDP-N-acetylmuramoylalanine--D-glutamate ligase